MTAAQLFARREGFGVYRQSTDLYALVEKGLIEKSKKDDRTNEYTLTSRGLREIEARREWENELVGAEIETPAV